MNARTASGITVNAVTVSGGNGQTVEYAVSTGTTAPSSGWQPGTSFSELTSATAYYVFARSASNDNYNAGTARMSAEIKTYGTLTDTRDSKTYYTIEIGTQTWMAENLNYAATGSKCYQNNDSNCDTYGRLYNWATAMAIDASYNTTSYTVTTPHQGVCPSGWHLPTNDEWGTLVTAVGSSAGTKLKASNALWTTNTGTDDYGFSALPGGYGSSDGSFIDVGGYGNWWSATENDATNARYRYMFGSSSVVGANYDYKCYLYSVRCVQD